jgi:beta-lactamase superfamily II metal-dependent hydrolase
MPSKKNKPKSSDDVTVRMFCQGLGDCFLISIPQSGAKPYHILIDCGVAMGTPEADKIMPKVVSKINELTNGSVDLLVITHEHWDHVSGFIQAFTDLKALKFKNLWFAWTENEDDPVARDLMARKKKARATLTRVAQMARSAALGSHAATQSFSRALDGVLAFHGIGAAADSGANKLDEAMANARSLISGEGGKKSIECLMPGKVVGLPGSTSGVRAYILGPPHDAAKVRKIDPSSAHPETYEKAPKVPKPAMAMGFSWSWQAALAATGTLSKVASDAEDLRQVEKSMPFDRQWRLPGADAKADSFFKEHYFNVADQEQRRIDADWLLRGAQQLALQLESFTNNTSLVIALELPKSQKVLLFAGDAQVGNWLSWHDYEFAPEEKRKVTATDLFSRTVLYKVGHHGSHNATLREKGLELMTHPELVAMLPVQAEAVKRLGYGEMPLQSLVKALMTRTRGRVLKLDEPWTSLKPPGTWSGLQEATIIPDGTRPLCMEYTIRDL